MRHVVGVSAPETVLLWLLTLSVAAWSAFAVGSAWVETRHAGGAVRGAAWACAVFSGAAFTWLYAALALGIAFSQGFVLAPEIAWVRALWWPGIVFGLVTAGLATLLARWADGYREHLEASSRARLDAMRGAYTGSRTTRGAVGRALGATAVRSRLGRRDRYDSGTAFFDAAGDTAWAASRASRAAGAARFSGGASGGGGASSRWGGIDLGDADGDTVKVLGVAAVLFLIVAAVCLGGITAAVIISRVTAADAPLPA